MNKKQFAGIKCNKDTVTQHKTFIAASLHVDDYLFI